MDTHGLRSNEQYKKRIFEAIDWPIFFTCSGRVMLRDRTGSIRNGVTVTSKRGLPLLILSRLSIRAKLPRHLSWQSTSISMIGRLSILNMKSRLVAGPGSALGYLVSH